MKLIQVITEDCCPEVLGAPLGAEEAAEVAAALRIVADPARLRLLSLISTADGGEACVCDLTEPVTFDLVGPPTPRPDTVPIPPDPDTESP